MYMHILTFFRIGAGLYTLCRHGTPFARFIGKLAYVRCCEGGYLTGQSRVDQQSEKFTRQRSR